MATTTRLTELRNPSPSPGNPGNGNGKKAVHPHQSQPSANPSRKSDRGVGLWLGGILPGVVGGCLFGASMANRHPVAMTLSVLWWGLYFGFFGWSIAAWIAFFTEPTPVSPAQERRNTTVNIPGTSGQLTVRRSRASQPTSTATSPSGPEPADGPSS